MWQIRNANCESSPKGVRLQVMCLILYDLLLAVDIVGSISTGASLYKKYSLSYLCFTLTENKAARRFPRPVPLGVAAGCETGLAQVCALNISARSSVSGRLWEEWPRFSQSTKDIHTAWSLL